MMVLRGGVRTSRINLSKCESVLEKGMDISRLEAGANDARESLTNDGVEGVENENLFDVTTNDKTP